MSPTVLLVEDDRELRSTLVQALSVEGYTVATAASVADARAQAAHRTPDRPMDIVLLDLSLPDGDGETLLADLRNGGQTPVLVISARHTDSPKIRLLDAGADDYLVKPFSLGELLARMRVALRHRGAPVRVLLTHYEKDGLSVDLDKRRVLRDGKAVHLTPTEFNLLARLVQNAGQVVTHRQLLTSVWGPEYIDHTHYLRLYMGQLRAKLEAKPAEPQVLLTEPGVGYRLADLQD